MPEPLPQSTEPHQTTEEGVAAVTGSRPDERRTAPTRFGKWPLVLGLALVIALLLWLTAGELSLSALAAREHQLREWQRSMPVLVYGGALLLYVVVTGLSLPGAVPLTLVYGWFFGPCRGVLVVSFGSTGGATLAFLLSRYLLHESIERRFPVRLEQVNVALRRDGVWALLTMRLIPAIPFFVINLVMGLTAMRVWTFWWVSQLGMLPGTMVYVYAGSRVPSLATLADDGIGAVFSRGQRTQILIAFVLLGLFPWLVKLLVRLVRGPATDAARSTSISE
ncbi:MAG: TVP38/TMEM64 family protein [Planctomycetaceae bacterium]|nr:TVP38/TMEM64 family protein [Planctomycetaceae bacterium]